MRSSKRLVFIRSRLAGFDRSLTLFATVEELEAVLTQALRPFWEDTRRVLSLVFGWLHTQANASS